jgi:hypothetical protein
VPFDLGKFAARLERRRDRPKRLRPFTSGPGMPCGLWIGTTGADYVQANASFVAAVPDSLRGQAFGLALGGMYLGQVAVMTDARAAAEHADALPVIAVAGAAGAAAAVLIWSAVERAYTQVVFRIAGLRSLLVRWAA